MTVALILLVSWGVLSFGAVRPWAYAPLFATSLLIGGFAAWRARASRSRPLEVSLLAVVVAGLLQIVPLPQATLRSLSPSAEPLLGQYEIAYSVGAGHALSIRPARTLVAVASFAALAVLLVGLVRWFSVFGVRGFATGLAALGLVVAMAALIQQASGTQQILGIWTPPTRGDSFGPFVNRNHYGGWMMMAIPLTLAAAGRSLDTTIGSIRGRAWMEWTASPEALRLFLLSAAAAVMTASVVFSASRSGLVGVGVALTIVGLASLRLHRSWQGRILGVLLISAAVLTAVAWGRVGIATDHFKSAGAAMGWRAAIWNDALAVIADFWLTGTGLNTYGSAMLFYQTVPIPLHFAQAHNDYLQLTAEGGLLVALPVAVTLILVGVHVVRRARTDAGSGDAGWLRLGAVAGILAIAVQEISDFSLQMPGNAVLFVVLLALALHRSPRPSKRTAGRHPIAASGS